MKRWWCAECSYPGKESFVVGSVYVEADTTEEAHREARKEIASLWSRISPYPAPDITNLIPGRLIVHEDRA